MLSQKKILQLTIIFITLGILVFLLGYLRGNIETFTLTECANADSSGSNHTVIDNCIYNRIPIALPIGTTRHMTKFHNGGTTTAHAADHNHRTKVGHGNDVFHYHVNT